MIRAYSRYWWLLALRGVAAIIFGVLAFIVPGVTLYVLILLFGVYAIVDGLLAIIQSFNHRAENHRWWVTFLEGLAGVAVGVLAFLWPGITGLTLLFLIAAWALVTGIFEIVAAIRLRKELRNEWALALTGALSILLALLLFFSPGAGAIGLVWAIGAYAILFGILMVYLAFKVRGTSHHVMA